MEIMWYIFLLVNMDFRISVRIFNKHGLPKFTRSKKFRSWKLSSEFQRVQNFEAYFKITLQIQFLEVI